MAEEEVEEQEPSIEEILTSIRQIISDDDEEGEEGASVDGEEETRESDVDLSATEEEEEAIPEMKPDEVDEDPAIELTDIVEEPAEEEVAEPEPEPEPEIVEEPEPEPEPEPQPEEEAETVEEDVEVALQDADDTPAPAADDLDTLLTDDAETATYDGFSELVKKTAVENGGITLEEIVRSELNPLLRGWLDKHLPNIIERLVQEELAKISKRALDE